MSIMGLAVCAAIIASLAFGVYLRARQVSTVESRADAPPADFAHDVTPEEHRRAADYTIARTRFAIAHTTFHALVSILWLTLGFAPLYAAITMVVEPGLTRSVAFFMAFSFLSFVFDLPFAIAQAFGLEGRFGFNRATPAIFVLDQMKSLTLAAACAVPALYGLFGLLKVLPESWWIFGFIAFMSFVLALTIVYPTLIAPLFNHFTPLEDEQMKSRIQALVVKCDFELKGLLVMDASRRSTHGNAYFAGFGKARRIVFFDTLLQKHTPDEIEAILAHELGHFKLGHVRQMILQVAVIAFLAFLALRFAFSDGSVASWFSLPADPGLVLAILAVAKEPVLQVLTPVLAWRSRRAEFEADGFARDMVGREPMISALTRLTRDNLATLTPDPFYAKFYYSHPPVPVRVARLREA
jgi:STE24 endopeptidase